MVLHREKLVARLLAAIMALCTVGFVAASIAYLLGWRAGETSALLRYLTYVITPLFPFVGLTLAVVRTVVTTKEVRVDQGLWGPRIPIRAIRVCSVWAGPPVPKGAHVLMPTGTKAVLLEWEVQGKTQRALIGSNDPAALVQSIERARGAGTEPEASETGDVGREGRDVLDQADAGERRRDHQV
jgi:hypothetical protein